MSLLALDIGGTRIRAGWFSEDLTLHQRAEAPTLAEQPAEQIVQRIIETAQSRANW
jgi:predicted NBD/HSP70 family sugar kinase